MICVQNYSLYEITKGCEGYKCSYQELTSYNKCWSFYNTEQSCLVMRKLFMNWYETTSNISSIRCQEVKANESLIITAVKIIKLKRQAVGLVCIIKEKTECPGLYICNIMSARINKALPSKQENLVPAYQIGRRALILYSLVCFTFSKEWVLTCSKTIRSLKASIFPSGKTDQASSMLSV